MLLAGCGEGLEKKVVGTWTVDASKTVMAGSDSKDPAMQLMLRELMKTITLNVKADKTFEMQVIMPVKGTWSASGNKLILTPELAKGQTVSFGGKSTMEFVVDADGTSMSATFDDPKTRGTLVMVKAPPTK